MDTRREHTDRGYEAELRELRERILKMAGRVEVLVERSVQAFVVHDGEVAKETIELDHQINQDEVDIDALCFHILSRQSHEF